MQSSDLRPLRPYSDNAGTVFSGPGRNIETSGLEGQCEFRNRGAQMSKVRVAGFGISLDGFSAGIEQSLDDPLGKRGPEIFKWFFHTKTFRAMRGQEGGSIDVDDEFAARAMENFGAFILGRNMFGPVRGPWQDNSWKGWW